MQDRYVADEARVSISRRGESEHQQFRSRNDYEKYACADSEVNSWPDWN